MSVGDKIGITCFFISVIIYIWKAKNEILDELRKKDNVEVD